eukprot:PhF_6_TR40172/c1_g1_i1/m.59531/K16601/TTLL4; tubulin polyglutamylase TTLL4
MVRTRAMLRRTTFCLQALAWVPEVWAAQRSWRSSFFKVSTRDKRSSLDNWRRERAFSLLATMVETMKKTDKKVNLFWGMRLSDTQFQSLNAYQKVNHYPGTYYLGRKDHLLRGLARMRRQFGSSLFDFFPTTFFLPRDVSMLKSEMNRTVPTGGKKHIYIAKPPASSCGKGIYVFQKESEIPAVCLKGEATTEENAFVVQHYVPNPLLINGHKFDLRIYVAVTCYDPLRIYIYEEGLARFATEPFSLDPATLSNRFMHLTNYSVNHHSSKFVKNADTQAQKVDAPPSTSSEMESHKWSLSALIQYFNDHGWSWNTLWDRIKDLVVKTLLTSETIVVSKVGASVGNRETCFELYGFDVLLTDTHDPILMEVNVWPSLNCGSPLDKRIKGSLVTHLLNLVGLQPCDWKAPTNAAYCNNAKITSTSGSGNNAGEDVGMLSWLLGLARNTETCDVLRALEDEDQRRYGFTRIFPCSKGETKYIPLMEVIRPLSVAGCRWSLLKEQLSSHQSQFPHVDPTWYVLWLQQPNNTPLPREVLAAARELFPSIPRGPGSHVILRRKSDVYLTNERRNSAAKDTNDGAVDKKGVERRRNSSLVLRRK